MGFKNSALKYRLLSYYGKTLDEWVMIIDIEGGVVALREFTQYKPSETQRPI